MSQTPEQNHSQEEDNIPLQHDAEHERPPRNKQQSVLIYLVILFAAAFLLMALSYFMQRRTSDATIEGLRGQSVSAMQSVEDIQEENETLKQQVADLEEQLEEAQRELDGMQDTLDTLTVREEKLIQAMDLFWQIDEAYVRGRYSLCRTLIAQMEDTTQGSALKESLPTETTTDTDRFSPADRYQEIYDAVM
ncbi:hypothetical protein AAAT94_14395 [Intestinimonas aquisgranensis]|nr:hypothetical protein [Intestinimonas aquisgranensis]